MTMTTRPRSLSKSESKAALRDAQLGYIRRAIELDPRKRPASRIAKDAGLNHSTLTEFLRPNASKTLDALTIRRVAETTGVEPSLDLIPAGGVAPGGFGEAVVPFDHRAPDVEPLVTKLVDLLIGDRPNAAPKQLQTHSLEAGGYLPGDIVIFDMSVTPEPGDLVQAQVEHLRTTLYRIYNRAGVVPLLMPAEAGEQALMVDGRDVRIAAVATQTVRQRGLKLV